MTRLDLPTVIGVDPGPTTGICVLELHASVSGPVTASLLQCTPEVAAHVVRSFSFGQVVQVAVERFVVGPRSARSAHAAAGRVTRDLVGELAGLAEEIGAPVLQRPAAQVKPWASDRRLERAGLVVRGMPHAKDAARHALWAACHEFGFPDPLSAPSRPTA